MPNINSSQSIIMEQFDQLEGFDQENTSQYSSFNLLPNINQYATNAYDKLKNVTETSYQNVAQFGHNLGQNVAQFGHNLGQNVAQFGQNLGPNIKTGYYNIRNELGKDFGELGSDIKSINIQDFYASDPASQMLRYDMQNPLILPAVNNLAYNLQGTSIGVQPGQPVNRPKYIIDNNSLVLLIILLILFVIWKYFDRK
jgi:hypothetical protein